MDRWQAGRLGMKSTRTMTARMPESERLAMGCDKRFKTKARNNGGDVGGDDGDGGGGDRVRTGTRHKDPLPERPSGPCC